MSSSGSCLALSVLMANLQGRRSPGTPTECRNKLQTGYGPQVEPANVSPYTGGCMEGAVELEQHQQQQRQRQ
ncbi:hypothetical protein MNEG_5649, partial [Monoraphidium neglectum]